ncbi:MAG: hypothetical protein WD066_12780, partial [Planctomycetaceae bacterium]
SHGSTFGKSASICEIRECRTPSLRPPSQKDNPRITRIFADFIANPWAGNLRTLQKFETLVARMAAGDSAEFVEPLHSPVFSASSAPSAVRFYRGA